LKIYLGTKKVRGSFTFLGEVPLHLLNLKFELEKTAKSLEEKNEVLVQAMMKNFGQTSQQLPSIKQPNQSMQEGMTEEKVF
jgi:hypothetical protein